MRNFFVATALGTALLSASPVWAVSITINSENWYNAANNLSPSPGSYEKTDFNGLTQKITLAKFDTRLGTLTAATLTFFAQANSVGSLTNNGKATVAVKSYAASLDTRLLAPSSATTGPGITTPANTNTAYLLDDRPTLLTIGRSSLAAGKSVSFSVNGVSDSHTLNLFTATVLPFFESVGPGDVVLPVFTSTLTTASVTGGNLDLLQTTSARVQAIVSYTYTPDLVLSLSVPEPVSIALLGSTLVGLGLVRQRKS